MSGSAATRLSVLLLVATAGCAQAAFPNFTNLLLAELTACVPAAQSDVKCLVPVSTGLLRLQIVLVEVHNVSGSLQDLSTVASMTSTIADSVTLIPVIGQVLSPVALLIRGLATTVDLASKTAGAVDGVTWPFKRKVDSVIAGTNGVVKLLNTTASLCVSGGTLVNRTRNTVAALPRGPVSGNLTLIMENFAGFAQRPVNLAVRAMSTSGSACASILPLMSKLPNMTMFKEGVDAVSRYLGPIFQKLDYLWNHDYCLSLFKIAKDDAEIATIVDLIAQRKIVARSQDGADFTDFAALKRDTRALWPLRYCVNLKNITNAIKGFPDFIVNYIYKALKAVLSELNLPSAPGLPSFKSLQDFATSLGTQFVDLQFNSTILNQLATTGFDCPAAVLDACASVRPISSVLAVCYKTIG